MTTATRSRYGDFQTIGARTTMRIIPISTLSNGHEMSLYVHELTGEQPGPTLAITGGVHGDEELGPDIIHQILRHIDPAKLKGRIVALPVANPYSYQVLNRSTPIDAGNLNRVFPGGGEGWVTEKIAELITREILDQCDYYIDFHSGGDLRTVEYCYFDPDNADWARAFGAKIYYMAPGYSGSSSSYTRAKGIPTIVAELGGGQQRNDAYIGKAIRGVHGVLMAAGMLDGEPAIPDGQMLVTDLVAVRPQHGGIMYTDLTLDDMNTTIAGGTVMGRVISPYTLEVLDELTAPYDESYVIVVQVDGTLAEAGGYGFMAANASNATAL